MSKETIQIPQGSIKRTVISWLLLIALSVMSIYMGLFIQNKSLFIISVLFIVFLKGQQIIDIFMELYHAPKKWRLLFLSYVVLLPLIICLVYLF